MCPEVTHKVPDVIKNDRESRRLVGIFILLTPNRICLNLHCMTFKVVDNYFIVAFQIVTKVHFFLVPSEFLHFVKDQNLHRVKNQNIRIPHS